MKIKVSCVQMEPKLYDVQYNLEKDDESYY